MSRSNTFDGEPAQRHRPRLQDLADRLRQRGEELGLSGAEVARRCGISAAQYNHYLNGKREPNLDILRRVCQVLGIAADHLIDGPALFFGDAITGRAMANLSEVVRDLTKDELELLADVASCAQARRKRDDFVLYTPDARWEILARVHERLIPAFIRLYRPREFSTVLVHGHTERLTSVELTAELAGVKQPAAAEATLRALIKECIGFGEDRVRVRVRRRDEETVVATCAIIAGAHGRSKPLA